jgi:hypothetical protein
MKGPPGVVGDALEASSFDCCMYCTLLETNARWRRGLADLLAE